MKYYDPENLTGYNFKTDFYFSYFYQKPENSFLLWIDFNSIFKEEVDPNIFRKFVR